MKYAKVERSFASSVETMSLWEVAHRWAGFHPQETNAWKLPVAVKDIFQALTDAQSKHELSSVDDDDCLICIESVYRDWRFYMEGGPDDPEEERRARYETKARSEAYRHIAQMEKYSTFWYKFGLSNRYYRKMKVSRWNLAYWTLDHSYPFPDFWFNPEEREQFIREYDAEELVWEKVAELEAEGQTVTRRMLMDMLTEYQDQTALQIEDESAKRSKDKQDIDTFWKSLKTPQKDRLLCREIAVKLWEENPHFTIEDMESSAIINKYALSRAYTSKNTIRNWIKELDPRPDNERVGRPPKRNFPSN